MCLSVDNCCCCFSLELGTKMISILFTFISVCTVVLYAPLAVLGVGGSMPHTRIIFYGTLAVLALVEIFIGGLLIHGAFKRKPQFTWPWLVLAWWKGLVLLILTVAGMVLLMFSKNVDMAEASSVISAYFVYSGLLLYFAVVVNSRRQELVLENYWANKHVLLHAKTQYYYV